MSIADLYRNTEKTLFSIEVIPPRNGVTLEDTVLATLDPLVDFDLAFISVTHHAKNSLKAGTGTIAGILEARYGVPVLAHLTCTDSSVEDIENRLAELNFIKIHNVLALRGDPPTDQEKFEPHTNGHHFASQLVQQITAMNNGEYLLRPSDIRRFKLPDDATSRPGTQTEFSIAIACYPEGHSENPDAYDDLLRLKEKFDAGAAYAISQMFFDAQTFLDFERRAREIGIHQPLIPGIKPVTSYKVLVRLAENKRFGITIPQDLLDRMEAHQDDKKAMRKIGIEYCVEQCRTLIEAGVPGIHFYSMNGKRDVKSVLEELTSQEQHLPLLLDLVGS